MPRTTMSRKVRGYGEKQRAMSPLLVFEPRPRQKSGDADLQPGIEIEEAKELAHRLNAQGSKLSVVKFGEWAAHSYVRSCLKLLRQRECAPPSGLRRTVLPFGQRLLAPCANGS